MSASALAVAAWRLAAIAARLVGNDAATLRARRRIAAARPDDPRALASTAHAAAACDANEEAIGLLRHAAAAAPDHAPHWFNLGFLLQREGLDADAIDAFDRALAVDAALDRAHYGRALSMMRIGRTAEAATGMLRAAELQPMSPYAWYQLGHARHRLGDTDGVARVVNRLRGFEPEVARRLELETAAVPAGPAP